MRPQVVLTQYPATLGKRVNKRSLISGLPKDGQPERCPPQGGQPELRQFKRGHPERSLHVLLGCANEPDSKLRGRVSGVSGDVPPYRERIFVAAPVSQWGRGNSQ
jgi:hypothetical protein